MADNNNKNKRKIEEVEQDLSEVRKKIKIAQVDLSILEEELQALQNTKHVNDHLIPLQSKIPSLVASNKQVVLIKDSILGSYWSKNQDKYKDSIKTREACIKIPVTRDTESVYTAEGGDFDREYGEWYYDRDYYLHCRRDSFVFVSKDKSFAGTVTQEKLINSLLLETLHRDIGVSQMIQNAGNVRPTYDTEYENTQHASINVQIWILTLQNSEEDDEDT